jgi:hypothetical protein
MITFDFISIFPLSHGNTRLQFNQSLLDQTRGVNRIQNRRAKKEIPEKVQKSLIEISDYRRQAQAGMH